MIQRFVPVCLLAAAFVFAAIPARANDDAVHFGSDIDVGPERTVHDAVCFFCSVNVEGTVNGDVVVFFGHVHIAGAANHDVVNFFGGVHAEDGATISQDLVSMFGSVEMGENASVGHDLVVMFGGADIADSVSVGNDRVIMPGLFFDVPLIVVVILLIVVAREYRSYRRRQFYRAYPFQPPR